MGVYVYSLRKKNKECDLMGIVPVKVISFEYAYKDSYVWSGDPGYRTYASLVARTEANAERARQHYLDAAKAEHGTEEIPYYIVYGGFEEGSTVYETVKGFLPDVEYDTHALSNSKVIGTLFKVGRRWTIEKTCPGHDWKYEGHFKSDYRKTKGMLPARSCKRCGKTEYADSNIQAQYEQNKAA